jgi:hypothetical protein
MYVIENYKNFNQDSSVFVKTFARLEVFMAMKIQISVFLVETQ